jgi:hypothetical protein
MKIAFAAIALIGVTLVAAPYFDFNPILPVFALLGLGLYGVCRGAPPLVWREGPTSVHGAGIYVDRNDNLVLGRERDTVYDVNDGAGREKGDRAKR